jgi:hypothetical protein
LFVLLFHLFLFPPIDQFCFSSVSQLNLATVFCSSMVLLPIRFRSLVVFSNPLEPPALVQQWPEPREFLTLRQHWLLS